MVPVLTVASFILPSGTNRTAAASGLSENSVEIWNVTWAISLSICLHLEGHAIINNRVKAMHIIGGSVYSNLFCCPTWVCLQWWAALPLPASEHPEHTLHVQWHTAMVTVCLWIHTSTLQMHQAASNSFCTEAGRASFLRTKHLDRILN